MAREPQARAGGPSAEDDFYDEENQLEPGDLGEGGGDPDEPPGTPEHPGQEDEFGNEIGEIPPQPSRGEGRIQRLANENRDLRRRLDDVERRTDQRPPAQRPENEQEMEQRIALLDESTKGYERWKWSNAQQSAQVQQTRIENALARDEAKFESICRRDKVASRMAKDVEAEFDRRFRAGVFVPREDIYYWLAGKERARGGGENQHAREAARQRVDRQTVRPAQAGSDVGRSRREKVDDRTARARRLDGVQI